YDHARYYDAVVGRFVSADITQGNAQGMDPYSYVGNNPETRNDPTGQRFCDPTGKQCEPQPCSGNCSPGSGNGGGGSPPPSGCTWNGKPCTKTNNPCIGTVWNGKGCVPGGQSQVDKDRAALDKHYADEKNFTSLIMEAFAVIIGIAEVFSLKGLLMWGVAAVLQAIVALGQAIHFAADIMLMLNHGVVTPTIKSLLELGLGLSAGGNALNALWIGMGWFASIGGLVVEATLTPELATIVFGSTLVVILAQANLIGMQAYFDTITAQQSAVDNSKNPGFVHAQCVSELGAANC
ncbi:MAG: RHS repeat-associated core domain-containing protein, partial [Ktedonobacteraceae bacterium]